MRTFLLHIPFRLLLLMLIGGALSACEETDCIYQDKRFCDPTFDRNIYEGLVPFSEDLSEYQQRHLLEEYTGFLCTNCPAATGTANLLKDMYPERLSLVGVHCSFIFAAPLSNTPGEPFSLDMRTESGEVYYETFTNLGPLPNGIIDRNKPALAPSSWEQELAQLMSVNNPSMFLRITDIQISADSSQLTAKVLVKPLIAPDEFTRYTLNLGLMENGIHEAQKDVGNVVLENYVHNHVFRGNSNGPWGIFAFDSDVEVPANQAMQYRLKIALEADWNLENCELFVYVSEEDTHNVIQIEEKAVVD